MSSSSSNHSPLQDQNNNNHDAATTATTALSLERKLELLESRFTTPATTTGTPPMEHGAVMTVVVDSEQQQQQHQRQTSPSLASPTASCHSFTFDPPTPSRSSSNFQHSEASTAASSPNLPASSVRSKQRSRNSSSTLRAVELAAARQMRKIAAAASSPSHSSSPFAPAQTVMRTPDAAEKNLSAIAASSYSSPFSTNSSNSNRTVLTSHRSVANQPSSRALVVAESPPVLISPQAEVAYVTSAPTDSVNRSEAREHKRKPVPVKRALPSVSTAAGKSSNNNNNDIISRKRSRLMSSASAERVTSPKVLDMSASRDRSNPPPTITASAATTTTTTAAGSTTVNTKSKGLRGNRRLEDFYGTVLKRGAVSRNITATTTVAAIVQSPSFGDTAMTDKHETVLVAGSIRTTAEDSQEMVRLRQRVEELERACQDKEEQLKAVSNNRTILHTALKSALAQREKELEEIKKSKERLAKNAARVIETLVRNASARDARELREKLALDGARLGRIVYTRAGLRSTLESWEDGHATKSLEKRRKDLQAQREALQQRQEAAHLAALQVSERMTNKENSHGPFELVGGVLVQTELDAAEAEESVRFHLENLLEKEKELEKEEQALHDEKGVHVRALKRVASEDASRFRSRPTLHDRYVLLSLLGKGGFSEVWRAFDLVELREVAVKIHQLDPRWSDSKKENYTKHVSREYEIHRDVRHPRIVSLYDVFEIDNHSFATVLECCNGTDLDSLLKSKRYLPERDARAMLLQILSGMQYLSQPDITNHRGSGGSSHRQGIIHYDLKPGNILFDEHGDAKITDFGLSKIVDAPDPGESMELTSQGAGTYWYLPPECFVTTQSVRISNKVDVWSIGVIFYQMLYGKRPFGDGQSQDRLITDHTMLNARDVKFPDEPHVSEAGRQFIRQCLTYDQAFRPTIGQLCKNPYVVNKQF